MQGVLYLSVHGIDIKSWASIASIDDKIDQISNLIETVNLSNYAEILVPSDWYDEKVDGKDFWSWLVDLCAGDQIFLGHFALKMHATPFMRYMKTGVSYEEAENNLLNNPNERALEYYGALTVKDAWPSLPKYLCISDQKDLYEWAIKFLAEHPISESCYASRSRKIFGNIQFHPSFADTLVKHGVATADSDYATAAETGIQGFSNGVTKSLQVLNEMDLSSGNSEGWVKEIGSKTGFKCSPEGSDKDHLKIDWGGAVGLVNCEFHVKVRDSNKKDSGDGTHYQDRIYFGFKEIGSQMTIFVYHSGQHL